jgi:hypothetical protein
MLRANLYFEWLRLRYFERLRLVLSDLGPWSDWQSPELVLRLIRLPYLEVSGLALRRLRHQSSPL